MKQRKKKVLNITIYIVLRVLVVVTMIFQFFNKNYNNVFMCVLTLVLFTIPTFVDRKMNIKLPTALEIVILLFIFSAEILGEIQRFYLVFQHWDTMLHTINGFLMAAIGFAMIDILNRDPRFHINMSPVFVAFVAFCFSMTIGVLWEFFEFGMDLFTLTDMQKDYLYQTVATVSLNPTGANVPVVISDIQNTVVQGVVDGKMTQTVIEGGYLDLGIMDTMKDLLVNCLGAVVFSILGLFYIKGRGEGRIVRSFIPQLKTKAEIEETRLEYEARKKKKK